MKASLETIFSDEHLLDYGRACVDVSLDIGSRDIDTLLIPSRGAFPIFLGAVSALKYIGREYEEYEIWRNRLNPIISINGELNDYVPKPNIPQEEHINILFCPFTADLNIIGRSVDNTEMTRLVRDYWSKVTASFFLPPVERKHDAYFKSFSDVVLGFIVELALPEITVSIKSIFLFICGKER